jgi:hypothetical protein
LHSWIAARVSEMSGRRAVRQRKMLEGPIDGLDRRAESAAPESLLAGMRTTLISTAAVVVAALGALTIAQPAAAGAPTCFNKGKPLVVGGPASEGKETVLSACRGASDRDGDAVWREYGMINIGPRATVADSCQMKLRAFHDGAFSKPKWRSCDDALKRRGITFTYYGFNTGFMNEDDTSTEACYELKKGDRRVQGGCVLSKSVDALDQ